MGGAASARIDWSHMFDADLTLPAAIGLAYAALVAGRRGVRSEAGDGAFGVLVPGLAPVSLMISPSSTSKIDVYVPRCRRLLHDPPYGS